MSTKKIVAICILAVFGLLVGLNYFKKQRVDEYSKPDSQSKFEFILNDHSKQQQYIENGFYTYASFDDVELTQYFAHPDFKKIYEYKVGSSPVGQLVIKYIYKDEKNGFPQRVIFYRGRSVEENLPIGKDMFYQAYFRESINQFQFDSLINKITQELAFKYAPKDYNNVSIVLEDKDGNNIKSESVEGKIKNPLKY
ncbi:hypothetical protein N5D03_13720 [Empedobacter sp. GD03861]|uniref:hypothetical protein n=1 Tax=Empedobacter sp. GD03861 TaxID=2975390 RepID=UPI002447CD84|nr:hypothetical protein [Empedobacter sp. GD03861]MDH0675597.1 hypothetical protein [Empedobacter sp. GD03861]